LSLVHLVLLWISLVVIRHLILVAVLRHLHVLEADHIRSLRDGTHRSIIVIKGLVERIKLRNYILELLVVLDAEVVWGVNRLVLLLVS
jgi:hypothetical protein